MFPVALVSLAAALVPPPVTFRPDYKDKPLAEIVEQIEQRSELMFISKREPTGTITLKVDRDVTAIELIQLLNDKLESRKVGFSARSFYFSYFEFDDFDKRNFPRQFVRPNELDRCHRREIVEFFVTLPIGMKTDEASKIAKKHMSKEGQIVRVFEGLTPQPKSDTEQGGGWGGVRVSERADARRFRLRQEDQQARPGRLVILDRAENLRAIRDALSSPVKK